MRIPPLAIALLLSCVACSQEDAPAGEIAEAAEQIVDPSPAPTALARGKYGPQDACGEVEGAEAFRDRLAAAVRARDTDALVSLAATDVTLDFGGGSGSGELRKRLDEPAGELWDELAKLMTLGCAANEQGGITIPWFFEQDLGKADPYTAMLVTGTDVPVFSRPDSAAQRIGAISWDLADIAAFDSANRYQQIKLGEGATGYVATDKLRSQLAYRVIASSRNGKWSITSLVAGD
jgi:hypothetical protein